MENWANLSTDWAGLPAHSSGHRSLTCNSAFPELPNCYRCMAKTNETTEQAGDTSRQFLKKAQDHHHTNTSIGSSISSWKEEESAENGLSASNNISRGLPCDAA